MNANVIAEQFEADRPRLHAVAYRMLGSATDADDAVQEAWLRLNRSDAGEIGNLSAWLTTVVGRVALDMLRARKRRREDYAGSWLPEPVVTTRDGDGDPAREAEIADSVGLALLVVLDTLAPKERLAFVLHDMFGVPFGEIATTLGSTPENARQLASRARRRVRGAPVIDTDLDRQRELVEAFLAAARDGDFDAIVSVLDPDVVFHVDAGGGAGAREPVVGAERVARMASGRGRRFAQRAEVATVNGAPGVIVRAGERVIGVCGVTVSGGRIAELDLVTDPAKLRRVPPRARPR
jgi:RNA polymerase sigma-70 factor (ECF subfamily)